MHFCDRIMHVISKTFKSDPYGCKFEQDRIRMDLHPTEGYYLSSTKFLTITDIDGQQYKITVEALKKDDNDIK